MAAACVRPPVDEEVEEEGVVRDSAIFSLVMAVRVLAGTTSWMVKLRNCS